MLGENEVMKSEMNQLKSRLKLIFQYQAEEKNYQSQHHSFDFELGKSEKEKSWLKKRRKVFKIFFRSSNLAKIMKPNNLKEPKDNHIVSFLHLKKN